MIHKPNQPQWMKKHECHFLLNKLDFFLLLAFEPSFKLSSDTLIVQRFRVKYFRHICCKTISVSLSYSEYLGQSSVRHSHDTKFSIDLKRRDVPYLGHLPLPVPPSSTLRSWSCRLQQPHAYVRKRQSSREMVKMSIDSHSAHYSETLVSVFSTSCMPTGPPFTPHS